MESEWPGDCLPVVHVCWFVVIEPADPYFASRAGLEKPVGVYPLVPRNFSCGPTKGKLPIGDTLDANWG